MPSGSGKYPIRMVGASSSGNAAWPGLLIVYEDEKSQARWEFVPVGSSTWKLIVFTNEEKETIKYELEDRPFKSPRNRVVEIRLNRNRQQ